jgi:hypothetical protein
MEKRQNLTAFWALGVLNNIVYVIMLAGAKGEGGREQGREGGREIDLAMRASVCLLVLRISSSLPTLLFIATTHTEISAGGVGLVFLADIAPTFVVKLTAPYWYVL